MAIQAQLYSENHRFPSDWMDNGCGLNDFCFNLQQKQQLQNMPQQQLQNQQHINQNRFYENSLLVPTLKNTTPTPTTTTNNRFSMAFSQNIASQLDKQRQEIDQYLRLQNERLRFVVQEQSKKDLAVLLKKIESRALVLLKQKDAEIAKATKRRMELENFLRRLEMENQAWQRVATEHEATIVSLHNTIERVRENANGAEDAESCCGDNIEEETGEGEVGVSGYGEQGKMMVCRSCNSRSSCILFLPCRHLCSCKACEAFLDSCPVCTTKKMGSIETLIF